MRRCYVGRCKCGAIVAATVDDPSRKRKDVAKDVADFIASSLTIETMDVEEVRVTLQGCKCVKSKNQESLSLELSL